MRNLATFNVIFFMEVKVFKTILYLNDNKDARHNHLQIIFLELIHDYI